MPASKENTSVQETACQKADKDINKRDSKQNISTYSLTHTHKTQLHPSPKWNYLNIKIKTTQRTGSLPGTLNFLLSKSGKQMQTWNAKNTKTNKSVQNEHFF